MTYRRLDVTSYGSGRWAIIEARVVAIDPNEAGLPTPLLSRSLTGIIAGTALTGFITAETQPREGQIKVHLTEADLTLELADAPRAQAPYGWPGTSGQRQRRAGLLWRTVRALRQGRRLRALRRSTPGRHRPGDRRRLRGRRRRQRACNRPAGLGDEMTSVSNAAIAATIQADINAALAAIDRATARVQDYIKLAGQVGDTNPGVVAGLHHLAQVERDRAAYFEGRLPGLQAELARWTA